MDFLFEYYRFRPSALLAWSPGVGVRLEGGAWKFGDRQYALRLGDDAVFRASLLSAKLRSSTRWILSLLEAVQARPPLLACHGLHEWAMVYKAGKVRHTQTPLRVSMEVIREVVQAGPVVCTHYDAFRFFTPDAVPLNLHRPQAHTVQHLEQPGCLHVNMDIYRWAMKRYPLIPGELVADAFLLAAEIRAVDMRASPYDLRALGYEPIALETASGKETYRAYQKDFHQRSLQLRARLIDAYRSILKDLDQGASTGGSLIKGVASGSTNCE
ncbi:MAG: hypothetical protein JJ976_04685 [Rhodothermales bacterium]|nr:hypothetical protein [Rhodothermales bacterium]